MHCREAVLAGWNVQCSQSVEFRMVYLEGWIEGKKDGGRIEMGYVAGIITVTMMVGF